MTSYGPLFRSLAAMHRAGIPWLRAVESAGGGRTAFEPVRRALERGESLGTALRPLVDPLDAALIEAGERDGSLEEVLEEIADAHEEARQRRGEGVTALAYPIVLAHVAAILMPLPDLIQGNVSGALAWAAVILVPTWAFLLGRRRAMTRERPAPGAGDPLEPREPRWVVGPRRSMVEEADARALHALGRLLDAGIPVAEALDLAIPAGWGGRAAVDLAEARRRVARGRELAGAWQHVPPDLARQLASAEESGSLGDALRRGADVLRFSARMRRKRVAVVLPVVVLLAVGAIVAWRLFCFYGGLYGNLPGR